MSFRRLLRIFLVLLLLAVVALAAHAWWTGRALAARGRELAAGEYAAERLPRRWIDALLAVEDPAFYTHPGIDLETPGAGWTTLTQALVKLHFPGPHQGLAGKPLQSLRALVLDSVMSKDEQLTLFLHSAYLGHRHGRPVEGFPAAARAHYGKPLERLEDGQLHGLVAMLIAPDRLDPRLHPEAHAERLRRVQRLIAGDCTPQDWQDAALDGCAFGLDER